jgi:hypothetical protein
LQFRRSGQSVVAETRLAKRWWHFPARVSAREATGDLWG